MRITHFNLDVFVRLAQEAKGQPVMVVHDDGQEEMWFDDGGRHTHHFSNRRFDHEGKRLKAQVDWHECVKPFQNTTRFVLIPGRAER
jgi:hypothetical protein